MNDEIKEILEIFKQVDLEPEAGGCYNCPKKDKDKTCIGCLNNAKDKLLDYITNLQQENELLKIENKEFKKRLKKQVYVSLEQSKIIEKAVEYIKENAWYMNKDDEEILDRVGIEGLLDILNGDNNE